MSFEIQDLADILRVLILIELDKKAVSKSSLKRKIDNICSGRFNIEARDFDETLKNMVEEGLLSISGNYIKLTGRGTEISKEWRRFLLKNEPILEVIAGIADGVVTSLVIIASSIIAGLTAKMMLIASILSLIVVSITNFSSFLLGGITEDLADLTTLQNLIIYSLSDIPDKKEKEKAICLAKELLNLLRKKRSKMGFLSALTCGGATFLSTIIPIAAYLILPQPFDILFSFLIIGIMASLFLVHYRSRKMRIHWKITLLQTIAIIIGAVSASLLLGTNI